MQPFYTMMADDKTEAVIDGVKCIVRTTVSYTDEDSPQGIASGDDAEDSAYMARIHNGEIYSAVIRVKAYVHEAATGGHVATGVAYLGDCHVLAHSADTELFAIAEEYDLRTQALDDARAQLRTLVATVQPWVAA